MKRLILSLSFVLSLSLVFAQRGKPKLALLPSFPVQVDAELSEWEGKFFPMDADSSWSLALSNDEQYIYAAVRIKDIALQQEAARNGITININIDGKKRDGAQLTFPVPDDESIRAMLNDENLPNLNIREELIERSRGFRVKGFPRIIDGTLSFDNTYGVEASARMDDSNCLVYESRIPISALEIKDPNQPLSIQCVLNNRYSLLKKVLKERAAASRSSYYGRGMGAPSVKSPYRMKTDIWLKTTLNAN